ncbi:hypothetical protein [Roseivirga pacifica]|uniref:hypothetical protein n=1 Tax=Roseivirga pacifica TaxID=1267423 RepID=UPI003BAED9A6
MPKKKERRDPAYLREQGNRNAAVKKERRITFSLIKQIKGEGQSIEEWNESGLLQKLLIRLKHVGQHSVHEVKQMKLIKEYHKVKFPLDSGFTEPKHVSNVTWAVMHLTDNSKEVVVGYIEEDVFYIVFLDQEHQFWPTSKKNT